MITVHTVLLIVALLLFLLAAIGVVTRVNLVASGLFLVTLAYLLVSMRAVQ